MAGFLQGVKNFFTDEDTTDEGDGPDASVSPTGGLAAASSTRSPIDTSSILAQLMSNMQQAKDQREDKSAKWLALAAALGSPTKTGTLGETAANAAGALAKYRQEETTAKRERLDNLMKTQLGLAQIGATYDEKMASAAEKTAAALVAAGRPLTGSINNYRDENTNHYKRTWTQMENGAPVTYVQDMTDGTAPTALPPLVGVTMPPAASPPAAGATPVSPLRAATTPPQPGVSSAIAASQPKPQPPPSEGQTYMVFGQQVREGDLIEGKDGYTYIILPGGKPSRVSEQSTASKVAQAVDTDVGKLKGQALVTATNAWPKIQTLSNDERSVIDELRNHPGLDAILGYGINPAKGSLGSIKEKDPQSGETKERPRLLPNSPAADAYEIYSRVNGGVWLQGYQDALRGTGPVATKEGENAAKAQATLGRSQSLNAFLKHLDDREAQIIRSSRVAQSLKGEPQTYGLPPRDKNEWKPGQVFIAASGAVVKAAKDPQTGEIKMYPLNSYWQAQK